ncbi:MAG: hypothetical protein OFPII_27440 [Osedax symbiont Rs1]|nr:MAG: hypothetical protein OFPII_27440 [Osedax symbiont Rs1]
MKRTPNFRVAQSIEACDKKVYALSQCIVQKIYIEFELVMALQQIAQTIDSTVKPIY